VELSEPEVLAAGGVVLREGERGPEIVLVHRTLYDDWSLPKGKAKAGESAEACALREVEEETGLACTLEEELRSVSYLDGRGRTKLVRYWRMRTADGELRPTGEVDEARWVLLAEAASLLSYVRDRHVLESVAAGS
jgi:8-oxo-dGTP diphosphatase